MKKLLTLVALFAITTVGLYSQDSDSEAVQCTTVVIKALDIEKNQDLDFGTIAQGTSEEIDMNDSRLVKLTVTGQANTAVSVSFTVPADLETSAGDELEFTEDIQANDDDDATDASSLSSGSSITLNSNGNYFIYLGGEVEASASQVVGFYSGEVEFSVEY